MFMVRSVNGQQNYLMSHSVPIQMGQDWDGDMIGMESDARLLFREDLDIFFFFLNL